MKGALLCRNPVFPICFCATSFLPLPCNAVSDMSSFMRFSICATYFTLSEPWKCQKSQHQWKNEKTVQPKLYRSLFPHDVFLSGAAFPRLLIRKHKKVSKINVFKGREHGTKSKNLILTGTKGADVKISALFLSPRHRQPPYGVFSYPYLYPPEKCIN